MSTTPTTQSYGSSGRTDDVPDDDDNDRSDAPAGAEMARFYLGIITDLIGGPSGGNRYDDRDRAPSPLGGPGTPESRDRKLLAMFTLAQDVLTRLHWYRPPAMPDRPAMLPLTDLTVLTHLTAVRHKGERAGAGDREVASAFGNWKNELVKLEGESSSRLRMLLNVHDTLRAVDARGSDDLTSTIARVEEHIARYWDMHAPYPDAGSDRDRATATACRRDDLMPTWLMNGGRPPRFVPRQHADFNEPRREVFDPRGNMGTTEDDDFRDDDF